MIPQEDFVALILHLKQTHDYIFDVEQVHSKFKVLAGRIEQFVNVEYR